MRRDAAQWVVPRRYWCRDRLWNYFFYDGYRSYFFYDGYRRSILEVAFAAGGVGRALGKRSRQVNSCYENVEHGTGW